MLFLLIILDLTNIKKNTKPSVDLRERANCGEIMQNNEEFFYDT